MLVAILFGFLHITMHIPAIHTVMFGFYLTSMKFWPSGVNGNFVARSCGIETLLSFPYEKLLQGLCCADITFELS